MSRQAVISARSSQIAVLEMTKLDPSIKLPKKSKEKFRLKVRLHKSLSFGAENLLALFKLMQTHPYVYTMSYVRS